MQDVVISKMKTRNLIPDICDYFILFFFLGLDCAFIRTEKAVIFGKVKLSDNPATGHGGVLITAGQISTYSNADGQFELWGSIINERSFEVSFKKEGYMPKLVIANLKKGLFPGEKDSIFLADLGTITLEKIFQDTGFFDNFNDGNADDWIEDEEARYRVENGEYSIESRDDGYQHWARREFSPRPLNNFLLKARVKYVSGRTNEPYGIGVFDTMNIRTCLFITKTGYYKLAYYNPQTGWHNIKDWTFSNSIDTVSGRWNRLEMEKTGEFLKIGINDSFLGSFSANSINIVNWVGLYVQGNLHIHFDDVRAESKR